jgi:hypothetical protein
MILPERPFHVAGRHPTNLDAGPCAVRGTVKKYGKDSPEAAEALANFKACRLADHVKDVLAEAPPMTDERRQRIAALLLAGR